MRPTGSNAPAVQGRIALEESEAVSRLFVATLVHYLSRVEREKRARCGSDLDLASVFEAVAIDATEPATADPGSSMAGNKRCDED